MSEITKNGFTGLILAGGAGTRLGGVNKAFLETADSTILEACVEQLLRHTNQVVVGLPPDLVARGQALVGDSAAVIAGGDTRQATLENVLAHAICDWILIHDVARPLASDAMFERVLGATREFDAVAPVVPVGVRDSLAIVDGGVLGDPVDRSRLVGIQTPYGFKGALLRDALSRARQLGIVASSVTSLMGLVDAKVHVVEGEPGNVKITYPDDWEFVRGRLGASGS